MATPTDIVGGIPYPAALLDPHLQIQFINTRFEALAGYTTAQVREIEISQILRPNIDTEQLRKDLKNGRSITREGNIISGARKKMAARITATPITESTGAISDILLVVEESSKQQNYGCGNFGINMAESIIGHSPKMQAIFDMLPVLAHTDATVLITGETGTGKDLLAEEIHQCSSRAHNPFIKVNSGALPEALLESELFGHQKGAFTGAHCDKPGIFRMAQGGTVFLTEIGDLPFQLQVKLLTFLDDHEFYPLGSTKKVHVDIRVITGTHRDLRQLVKEGLFREDLFYRLNVLRAHLPPLRERREDIPLLLDFFVQQFCERMHKNINGITPEARLLLENFIYPGNIRELRNIIEFGVSLCREETIDVNHLPPYIRTPEPEPDLFFSTETQNGPHYASNTMPEPADSFEYSSGWKDIEKKRILTALVNNNGNRTKTAKELGLGRSTLWRKMKQLKIE